ncbi:MAG: family 10 glycosylhydrolase [Muribaculaceae bacterium]|nr:family 10 glycosylhydrolase [Muribaculaceae bacterium]
MKMRKFLSLLSVAMLVLGVSAKSPNPKTEFRGAWMHTVHQQQYARQNTEENKEYLRRQLDSLKYAGVNAVLFQVRPSADAFYESKLEPWSRFLTDNGNPPAPYWDPLEFMVEETHKRGMELHAWLNPYRVTTTKTEKLPKNHIYHKEPERFVRYEGDGRLYFDPGLPQNRKFIVDVITDITDRYDVDGIHFDDYFYPYPANGKDFPDDASYKKYGNGMDRGDWRRKNVDLLIEDVHNAISSGKKPWVRFGISPFGIWRNKTSDPRGSNTSGLENYDALYADVLLWAEKGWIDYLLPQLYWELGHKKASSLELVNWWNNAVDPKCQLYIGQDVERTMKTPDAPYSKAPDELDHKVELSRQLPNVQGNCWWPGYSITKNFMGVADRLASDLQSTVALVPAYPALSEGAPKAVTDLTLNGRVLNWKRDKMKGNASDQVKFVVYKFAQGAEHDYNDARNIYAVTPDTYVEIDGRGVYSVTALDRVNNESEPAAKIMSVK